MTRATLASLLGLLLLTISVPASAATLELKKGDHICIIGNTLAERMQHFGGLEARLHSRFPQHELVFRNLGFSADEVDPGKRLRSMDFGTPDQWLSGSAPIPQPKKLASLKEVRENRFELTNTRADVIFAFFGYNESFAGREGLEAFKKSLNQQLDHLLAQKYNGKSAPRIVLFSPIAHENLRDPNLPDGTENNARLKLYSAAMAEVAKARDIPFVDLFTPTLAAFSSSQEPNTINGIHLNEHGDALVAAIAEQGLFPEGPQFKRDAAALERLRQAVVDKNFYWFHRYRTTDGYSSYGDRAFLKFAAGHVYHEQGQSNYEVVQRELEVLDVLTSNRDLRVWAIAQGKEVKVEDANLPPFVPVVTNKPGPLPGGKHVFLGGEEAISKMTVHKGMKVELFASEEQFPELTNPVQMAFDTKGRLWVAVWHSYPHWKPTEPMNDKLLILEDTDGDGKADKSTAFAADLHNPTGFEFWGGGVIVARGPDILFLKDTDGDDKADVRVSLLHGLDTADTHHTSNSFTLDPGGALYFQEGTFHHTQVESPWGPARRLVNAGVFRYEPRAQKFDVYVSYGFANPHGHAFDHWGQDIVVDGTGAVPYHGALFSGHVDFPNKHKRTPQLYQQRTRPCPGIEFLASKQFPPEMRGNLLVGNVIGFQGILCYRVDDQESSFSATELDPIVSSTDPNFRPADIETGPDGAIYFTDWQNPIIGHMQHNLRDPNRDHEHGRVYRVRYEGFPLVKPAAIAGEPVERLLDLLKEPDDRVRYRARIELSGRKSSDVIAAVGRWVEKLDDKDPEAAHHALEALWVQQHHNVVNIPLLERSLTSKEFRARAAAVRVLCYWRDRVPAALELLKRAAADEHPRVRLEAVRAASFFAVPEAIEIPVIAAELPTDQYLDFVTGETLKTLQPYVDRAKLEDRQIAFTTAAGRRYVLRNLPTEELLKQQKTRDVSVELLSRSSLSDAQRRETIAALAKLDRKPETRVVVDLVLALDRDKTRTDPAAAVELLRQLTTSPSDPSAVRSELEQIAVSARQPLYRQLGYISLITLDGSTDGAWKLASGNVSRLQDFLAAVPLISDIGLRATLYNRVEPLLRELPAGIDGAANKGVEGHVRQAAMEALTQFRGQELKTFQTLSKFVLDDVDRAAAIRALQKVPKAFWPKEEAGPLLAVLVGSLSKLNVRARTTPAALDALEFANSLTALLPLDEARLMRTQLSELGVRMIRVGTLFERMSFDQDTIAVQAGKAVEFVLENSDLMPHNFVIVQPGSLEEIGMYAETNSQQPSFAARNFVPPSPKVLAASTLMQPRDTQKVPFTAPKEAGVYPFVCTYPGHWRRMYGALYVVDDLDAYLADPEGYLAAHPLPIKDEPLKDRRPRTEWKFDDLASAVQQVRGGRSYATGKQMFVVASCVSCHRVEEQGNQFGADLTKLDPKLKPVDILKDVLEPSSKINGKFQTFTFLLSSGKTVTGLVLEETPQKVKIIENPLAKAEPVEILKSDIDERQKSPTSLMPKGLLDKLSRDDILDLIAYVAARGDKNHALFQADGHEHHHAH